MQDGGFFGPIVFQGGTSLRLCHGPPVHSEDLDFAGGTGFGVDDLRGLGECVRSSLAGMSPDVQVKVREPVRDEGLVRRWRISIRTAAQRRDLPSQSIKLEVASVPAHEPQTEAGQGQLSLRVGDRRGHHPGGGKPHRDTRGQASVVCMLLPYPPS